MNRVLDRLYIGDATDLDGTAPLSVLGFVAVVDLRDGAHAVLPGVETFNLTNRDGDPWSKKQVAEVLGFIHERIQTGKVLVACAAGMSRSASVVVGYLARCGWSVVEAFGLVKGVRPRISPVEKMLGCVVGLR